MIKIASFFSILIIFFSFCCFFFHWILSESQTQYDFTAIRYQIKFGHKISASISFFFCAHEAITWKRVALKRSSHHNHPCPTNKTNHCERVDVLVWKTKDSHFFLVCRIFRHDTSFVHPTWQKRTRKEIKRWEVKKNLFLFTKAMQIRMIHGFLVSYFWHSITKSKIHQNNAPNWQEPIEHDFITMAECGVGKQKLKYYLNSNQTEERVISLEQYMGAINTWPLWKKWKTMAERVFLCVATTIKICGDKFSFTFAF